MTGPSHTWEFKARFRRHAFGWRSQPAIQRIKEAVAEIAKVSRKEPVVAGEGALCLLERLSPALEQVDSSSGSIGNAVYSAIAELVEVIAKAPVDSETRAAWLERLYAAHEADQIPYIERLTDFWGELCVTKEIASAWADKLISITRLALSPDKSIRGHFHGTSACLSALFRAERYPELIDLVQADVLWAYKRWAVKALAAQGKKADAVRYAEACRNPWAYDWEINQLCEEILLSSGLVDEAYARYGLVANRKGTFLATFRAVAKKYPQKGASEILSDLARTTPGEEGKWFAAAKDAGLFDEALALAESSPCDPKTLTRACRDHLSESPAFALGAGMLALHWLLLGHGYEIESADVWAAYRSTIAVAERQGNRDATKATIREMAARSPGSFAASILGRELAQP